MITERSKRLEEIRGVAHGERASNDEGRKKIIKELLFLIDTEFVPRSQVTAIFDELEKKKTMPDYGTELDDDFVLYRDILALRKHILGE